MLNLKWVVLFLAFVCSHAVESTVETGATRAPKNRWAYATILSTDSFLLPAKVVAHRLRKLDKEIPFVIFATQDVSRPTVLQLEEVGAVVRRIDKMDTPFARDHPEPKFQYTKTRLWCHTEYTSIVHIDLDTLHVQPTPELFQCGSFCASLRHSDMFNTGVFSLTPNNETCIDMIEASSRMASYDGGDQGFFNTYFPEVKYAPMFRPNTESINETAVSPLNSIQRLSAAYNFDVGMYYLSGRQLVQPKIIHYTLGPLKPWIWWSYPIFDMNWIWLEARKEMEAEFGHSVDMLAVVLCEVAFLAIIATAHMVLYLRPHKPRYAKDVEDDAATRIGQREQSYIGFFMIAFAAGAAFVTTPDQLWPSHAWILFVVNTSTLLIFQLTLYSRHRLNTNLPPSTAAQAAIAVAGTVLLWWNITHCISNHGTRYLFVIFAVAGILLFINHTIKWLLFGRSCNQLRYFSLRKR
uniref:Glycosyltransferase family 8 protein n=1 Tax=Panagrellus redivivus TaxID=6233 RepID=A0A7E4VYP2_PANRE